MRAPKKRTSSGSAASAAQVVPARGMQVIADFSFDALLQDEMVKLVMASDHVTENELRDLKDIHPLIA